MILGFLILSKWLSLVSGLHHYKGNSVPLLSIAGFFIALDVNREFIDALYMRVFLTCQIDSALYSIYKATTKNGGY
jgi:hypothetical protein